MQKHKKDWEEVHQTVASLLQEEKEWRYLQCSEYYFFVWIFFKILFMCYFYVRFNGKRNLQRCMHMGGEVFFPNLIWKHVRRRSAAPDMGRQAWHPCMEDSPDKCEQFYRTPASDKAILWPWWIMTSPLHNHVSTLAKSGTLSKPQKWPNTPISPTNPDT